MLSRSLMILMMLHLLFACQPDTEPVGYVDPFIGTGGHGHTFPGATMPFGMVQLSPDTRKDSWDGCSGYHYSDSTIMGFSHTHLSGTGVGDYGDIRLMPTTGKLLTVPGDEANPASGYRSSFSHSSEQASPGYYRVQLSDYNILAELTVTPRTGFHRYTFLDGGEANIIIDLFEGVTSDKVIGSEIEFINDTVVAGFRRTKGWARDQHVYFYAVFSKPFESFGIDNNGEKLPGKKMDSGTQLKAWAGYRLAPGEIVLVRVGISAVDTEGAKNNLLAENPHWDFEGVKAAASAEWNNELGKIDVKGNNQKDLRVFYTALYHTMIAPNLFSDSDGRYRGHDGLIHRENNQNRYTVFSLWDTFRTLHPLFNLFQAERNAAMIRSMLDIYDKGGLLPVWELAGNETWCMIGYHAVPVIADAWAWGNRNFDHQKALEAMMKSASQDHHGLQWYKQLGYIPANKESESVSKTLEYAYDDWCIASFAKSTGNDEVHNTFIQRAQYYRNLYDPGTRFFRGRQNGGFIDPFDPTQVNFMLTEANSWQYNFFVPQDINGHIELMGGPAEYEKMLDELFNSQEGLSGRQQSDITGLIGQYAHGNEPSHHMAYLYHYVGKPHKSQALLKRIMDELYTDQPDGLSGNEDCGQMSAWYVMSALGMYPVTPGSGYLVIGTPRFEQATIFLDQNKAFRIRAGNLSEKNIYIKSVSLNGMPYTRSYLPVAEIVKGGELVFEMTSSPASWGSSPADVPVQKITADAAFFPVPWVSSESKTFTTSIEVSMGHLNPDARIHYTLDGSEPDTSSTVFDTIIVLQQSAQIKALSVLNDLKSHTITAEFFRIPAGRSIELLTDYNAQYHAGGRSALIDNQRGTEDFRTGSWQGYHGNDLVAVVDLGSLQPVKEIQVGFLQDQNSWIFMPSWVKFEVSVDGLAFVDCGKVFNTLPSRTNGSVIRSFDQKITNQTVRFVKITAKNKGLCPDWHLGAGNPAWIFADEIIIK